MQKYMMEARSENVETRWKKHAEARSDTAGGLNSVSVIPYGKDSFTEVEDRILTLSTFITNDAHWMMLWRY